MNAEFLEAINDPEHEEHDRMLKWASEFDPEEFNAGKTTKVMRRRYRIGGNTDDEAKDRWALAYHVNDRVGSGLRGRRSARIL